MCSVSFGTWWLPIFLKICFTPHWISSRSFYPALVGFLCYDNDIKDVLTSRNLLHCLQIGFTVCSHLIYYLALVENISWKSNARAI